MLHKSLMANKSELCFETKHSRMLISLWTTTFDRNNGQYYWKWRFSNDYEPHCTYNLVIKRYHWGYRLLIYLFIHVERFWSNIFLEFRMKSIVMKHQTTFFVKPDWLQAMNKLMLSMYLVPIKTSEYWDYTNNVTF